MGDTDAPAVWKPRKGGSHPFSNMTGCGCNNYGGCNRAGSRCKIIPLHSLSVAELTEALKPSEERVGADEIVTMNVNDPNLPQVGLLARVVAQLGLLMP